MLTNKKKKSVSKKAAKNNAKPVKDFVLTEDSPFAIQEAYKTLRTNVLFSAVGEECKTVIITSSLQGEAKSTTSVNLAISLAQNKNRVLLVDADLRLPTAATKLGISQAPGLTDVLVGQAGITEAIVHMATGLDVLPAGRIPPNPSELLGSIRMKKLMEGFKDKYEYVIVDTPPVCTVADAAILAADAAGVILVVRQNYATRDSVSDAIQRLELAEAKILGFVFTDVANEKLKSYKNKYGNYGYGYGYAKSKSRSKGQDGQIGMPKSTMSDEEWMKRQEG